MNRRQTIVNIGLAVVSIFFTIAIFEFGLIVLDIGDVDSSQESQIKVCSGEASGNNFHEEYGWTRSPNSEIKIKRSDFQPWEKYVYNNNGFRDVFDTGSGKNIIITGDSFTMGTLATQNATYPHLLDRWTPDTNIRNYGITGYGTSNSLSVYRDRGKEINHDVIVHTHYNGNDMFDNTNERNRMRPIYEPTKNGVKLVRPPANHTDAQNRRVVQNKYLRSVISYLRSHSRTYNLLEPRIRNIFAQVGLAPELRDIPNQSVMDEQKNVTRGILQEMATQAEKNNAKLVIVSIPERGEVRPDRPSSLSPQNAVKYGDIQRQLLSNISESNDNISYIPMKFRLKSEVNKGNRVYGVKNGHLDDYGYRVTAMTIYDHLVEQNLIENSNPSFNKNYSDMAKDC